MKELEELDIALLYKSLVLLKDERQDETEFSATTPAAATQPASGTAHDEHDPVPVQAQPTAPPLRNPIRDWELALICPIAVKAAIQRPDSNMRKILEALKLTSVLDRILPAEKLKQTEWLHGLKAVWFVGMEAKRQELSENLAIPHLFSANPEELSTVEDKRAMFEPLKAFAPELQSHL